MYKLTWCFNLKHQHPVEKVCYDMSQVTENSYTNEADLLFLEPRNCCLLKWLLGVQWGRLKKKEIYVCLKLIHLIVQQKPTQPCKAIIFQLIFFLIFNNKSWMNEKNNSDKCWIVKLVICVVVWQKPTQHCKHFLNFWKSDDDDNEISIYSLCFSRSK